MDEMAASYCSFLDSVPGPHHFIDLCTKQLLKLGFKEHISCSKKIEKSGKYFIINGSMIFVLIMPEKIKKVHFTAVHIDSPAFKLNPNFSSIKKLEQSENHIELSISRYGGLLKHTWFDRELKISGAIQSSIGKELINDESLVCLIPSLPPHLNIDNYTAKSFNYPDIKAISSIQNKSKFENILKKSINHDLSLIPIEKAHFDKNSGWIFSGRHDNLSSSFCALESIKKSEITEGVLKIVGFYDYEEIGSLNHSGAFSQSITKLLNHYPEISLNDSFCLSVDAAHAFNPLNPINYESNHHCIIGKGIAIKYSPSYSTDMESAFILKKRFMQPQKLKFQEYTNSNKVRGGSTIGSMLSAQLNMKTVDLGIPIFAMHSIREVCSVEDLFDLKMLFDFFNQ